MKRLTGATLEGPRTVTVARVNDIRDDNSQCVVARVVGGLTSIAWSSSSSGEKHSDGTAFIFCNRSDPERFARFPIALTRADRKPSYTSATPCNQSPPLSDPPSEFLSANSKNSKLIDAGKRYLARVATVKTSK